MAYPGGRPRWRLGSDHVKHKSPPYDPSTVLRSLLPHGLLTLPRNELHFLSYDPPETQEA